MLNFCWYAVKSRGNVMEFWLTKSQSREAYQLVQQSVIFIFGVIQEYNELAIPLCDIPINVYTVSELVRLCLRKRDFDTESHVGSLDSEDNLAEHDVEEVVSLL